MGCLNVGVSVYRVNVYSVYIYVCVYLCTCIYIYMYIYICINRYTGVYQVCTPFNQSGKFA